MSNIHPPLTPQNQNLPLPATAASSSTNYKEHGPRTHPAITDLENPRRKQKTPHCHTPLLPPRALEVTGYGTGGTVTGVARVLRAERPDTKIILSEPVNAQLLGSGHAQERNTNGEPTVSHPAFEPHPIQGWTPDFIPQVLQEAVDHQLYDELHPVAGPDGIAWSKKLAQQEGIFTGISGGSSFAIAMDVAAAAAPGSVILCMLPDTGERYLSSPLFDGVVEDMSEAEIALSQSTPGYHMPAD